MQPTRIESLTSLRFFAAAIIVVLHATELFGKSAFVVNFACFHAVSFFYVLSGFILAYTYHGRLQDRAAISRYAWSRAARIFPVHAFTWLFALAFLPDARTQLSIAAANLTLLQSWVPSASWFYSVTGVSWSISDEVFFYAALPILLWDFKRTWSWKFAACASVTGATLWCARHSTGDLRLWSAYIVPTTRLTEFFAGIVAFKASHFIGARLKKTTCAKATLVEVAVLVSGALSMHFAAVFYGTRGMVSIFGTAFTLWVYSAASFPIFALLIAVFSAQAGFVSRLLCARLLTFLGEASFALYMVHLIVLRVLMQNPTILSSGPEWLRYLEFVVAALGTSIALHLLIENPVRRWLLALTHSRLIPSPSQTQQ